MNEMKVVTNLFLITVIFSTVIPFASATDIIIDTSHHHLGDGFKKELIPGEPEGVVYVNTFNLDSLSDIRSADLKLKAKGITPGPTDEFLNFVFLNGKEIGVLNDYVMPLPPDIETGIVNDSIPKDIVIPVETAFLQSGINTIKITSGTNVGGSNYDDFEFYDLELEIKKTGWILSGKVTYNDEPAGDAWIIIYRHGTEEPIGSVMTEFNGSYSIELQNGVYDVKAHRYDNLYGGPDSDIKKVEIADSNAILDLNMSDQNGLSAITMLLLGPVVILFLMGFVTATAVYIFTKKRKLALIGFVLGAIANLIVLFFLYQTGLMDIIGRWSLLLSAGIALTLVVGPIILMNKRQKKIGGD